MKSVPLATAKDRLSEYVAAAEAGEEIAITRHGKVAARLLPPSVDKAALRREAVERTRIFARNFREKYGPVSTAEILEWIEEDRR